MPGKIKVKVLAGRNLPVMDRSGDTTDAYVELKFGNITYKTDVCRKSLNPQWNSEWYKFEVDDAELQDEPLQIRLMDHDTYSANDAIGKVYINLNPLLLPGVVPSVKNIWTLEATMNSSTGSQGSVMSGWIPVFDTMHGIRGEVNIIIKVELFSDFNKFRQSSCGIQFFYSPNIPHGYYAQVIHGFVEELIVSDDPEYKWIDKIRTPRASNEARQTLFFKLSGEVQRKIGLKALDLGGNAVIGYLQNFDLEGESGIVARGIGTAVTLMKLHDTIGDTMALEDASLTFSSRSKLHTECIRADNKSPPFPVTSSFIFAPSLQNAYSNYMNLRCEGYRNPRKPFTNVVQYVSLNTNDTDGEPIFLKGNKLAANSKEYNTSLFPSRFLINDERSYSLSNRFKNIKQLSQSILGLSTASMKSERSDTSKERNETKSASEPCSDISFVLNAYQYVQKKVLTRDKNSGGRMAAILIKSICQDTWVDQGNKNDDSETTTSADECLFCIKDPTDCPIDLCDLQKFDNAWKSDLDEKLSLTEITESGCENECVPLLSSSETETSDSSQMQNDYIILEEPENIMDATVGTRLEYENERVPLILLSDSFQMQDDLRISEEPENFMELETLHLESSEPLAEQYKILRLDKNNCTKEIMHSDPVNRTADNNEGLIDTSINKELWETDRCSSMYTTNMGTLPNTLTNKRTKRAHNILSEKTKFDVLKRGEQTMTSAQSLPSLSLMFGSEKLLQKKPQIQSHNLLIINKNNRAPVEHTEIINESTYTMSHRSKHQSKPRIKRNIPENNLKLRGSQRLESMLHLMKIIDTKMMQPTDGDEYDFLESKKKKRNKVAMSTSNLSEKTTENFGLAMKRVSSCPKHLSSKICSKPLSGDYLYTFQTSLDCVHEPDDFHTSLCLLNKPHSSHLRKYSPSSSKHRHYSSYDAVGKSMIDCSYSDSLINSASTTFNSSKSKSTTHLTSSKKTGSAVYEYHSVFNLRETSYRNQFTKSTNSTNVAYNSCVSYPSPNLRQQDEASLSPSYPVLAIPPSVLAKTSQTPMPKVPLHRRSSDSDLSITPKGNSCPGSDRSTGFLRSSAAVVRTMNQDALEMLEYPFITMQHYPPGFIVHIGGLVSSRSVKLLERISNLEEPESRDSWWTEIRMEVRSHARALACNVVIGYREETSICDDVCVLNATGTAAVINLHNSGEDQDNMILGKLQQGLMITSGDTDREKSTQKVTASKIGKNEDCNQSVHQNGKVSRHTSESNEHETFYIPPQTGCSVCHIPYSEVGVPFRVNLSKCAICKRAKVPDVMFSTIELPEGIPLTGRGCFIQATVCKNKKDLRGELNAKEISDCLPFLEYELHSLLLNKLRVKGMNAVFGLRLQVSIGERLVIGMAIGTAAFLSALPAASVPQIASGNSWHDDEKLSEIQKDLVETVKRNREFYQLKPIGGVENGKVVNNSDTDESDDDLPELDFGFGARDSYILEVDDIEDMDRISLLLDDRPPNDFHVVNTQIIPGLEDLEIVRNLQMFAQVSRMKIPVTQIASMPSKYLARLLQTVYFKLRRMVPCALCNMQFKVALPEPDELQLSVIGMVLGLGEPLKTNRNKRKLLTQSSRKEQDDNDMIFNLDEDSTENTSGTENVLNNSTHSSASFTISGQKNKQRSPLTMKMPHQSHQHKHVPLKERYGVDITPLSYLPGGKINRYLGNLNFFFIRESTSIRENGGLSGFTHSFVMEVLAIVRAHVTALGGNAMVAFFMTQCVLLHSPHKNQGQCLINVGGDVVSVSYYTNEKQSNTHNC